MTSTVKQFPWTIQNTKFTSGMLIIPLECCDVVLGVQCLVILGGILHGTLISCPCSFFVQGKKLVLRGATSEGLKTARKMWEIHWHME